MKNTLKLWLVIAVVAVAAGGCVTQKAGHSMGCKMCSCKMMQPDSATPGKCKMCGHMASEHSKPAPEKPGDAKPDHKDHH
jgi:hypothetical protein